MAVIVQHFLFFQSQDLRVNCTSAFLCWRFLIHNILEMLLGLLYLVKCRSLTACFSTKVAYSAKHQQLLNINAKKKVLCQP